MKIYSILLITALFFSCASKKILNYENGMHYLSSRINSEYPPFDSISEDNKVKLVSIIFQQRYTLFNVENQMKLKRNESDILDVINKTQAALYFLPPESCKIVTSVSKIDSLNSNIYKYLGREILDVYDFYKIDIFSNDNRVYIFCPDSSGSTNYINLFMDSASFNKLKLKGFFMGVRKKSHFTLYTNSVIVPNILFLSQEFVEFNISKDYLSFILFNLNENTLDTYTDWLCLLSYSNYNPTNIAIKYENENRIVYSFYSLSNSREYLATVFKRYPYKIEYSKIN